MDLQECHDLLTLAKVGKVVQCVLVIVGKIWVFPKIMVPPNHPF